MVTSAGISSTKKFISSYHISDCQKFSVFTDSSFKFYSIFGATVVPSFFIYKDGIFLKKWLGETKIENLLKN